MVMSEMKAGDRTLSRAAGMVTQAKGDFDRLSSTLSDNLLALQARWQGQGGGAFTNLHQAWREEQDRIVLALDEFQAALTSTERDNTGTDQSQSDSVTRHRSRLDGVRF